MPLWKPFQHYDPKDEIHTSNATKLISKLSHEHRLVGEAFSLVLYPAPSKEPEIELEDEKQLLLEGLD